MKKTLNLENKAVIKIAIDKVSIKKMRMIRQSTNSKLKALKDSDRLKVYKRKSHYFQAKKKINKSLSFSNLIIRSKTNPRNNKSSIRLHILKINFYRSLGRK